MRRPISRFYIAWGQQVHKLVMSSGKLPDFSTRHSNVRSDLAEKHGLLARVCPDFYYRLSTTFYGRLLSVLENVLPTIHTAYNNNDKIRNYFIINY